jgi:formylglycine-generating enzyme required for sulfatase activity
VAPSLLFRRSVALVITLAIVTLAALGYFVYLRVQVRRGPPSGSARSEPAPTDPPALKLGYLADRANGRSDVWAPDSKVVSERFIEGMTPEAFTAAPWGPGGISMPALLDVVERSRRLFVRSPELFGAMTFAVEEAGLREKTLAPRARQVVAALRSEFIAYHSRETPGFQAPSASPRDDPLNPAIVLSGGRFVMGSNDLFTSEHRVSVSGFAIQRHEVTNEEFMRFKPTHRFRDGEQHDPVDSVSWYDAVAYAAWLGGSLPTEAQWEFAARGREGRVYPWGNTPPTPERANFLTDYAHARIEPVGSHPRGATPDGVEDLAGNVWEWCRDWFDVYQPGSTIDADPLGPLRGTGRVLRGGSYFYDATLLKAALRNNDLPSSRYLNYGFRVAFPVGDP